MAYNKNINYTLDVDEKTEGSTASDINETKDPFDLINEKLNKTEIEIQKSKEIAEKSVNWVLVGWVAVVFVIIGLFLNVYQIWRQEKKDNLTERMYIYDKISKNENDIKNLKLCLYSNGWMNPKCFNDN